MQQPLRVKSQQTRPGIVGFFVLSVVSDFGSVTKEKNSPCGCWRIELAIVPRGQDVSLLDDAAVLRLDVHLDVLCYQLQAVDAQGGADPLPEVWAVQDEQNHEQGEADQVRNVEQLKKLSNHKFKSSS